MNIFQEAKQILDKDGKVNPLGPYGKQKLTGQEIANYHKKNGLTKVHDRLKKAVEVALDLGGAMDIATKEIQKFYGSNILKNKEVQKALKYANEETVSEKFKPYMPKGYERVTDLYIQFRGDEKQSKKDFEQAKKIVSAYSKKHKLDIRDNPRNQVFGSPEQGSSAYKVSIFAKLTKDANHDLAPLYTELSKLKTAEDHGGGNAKPITEETITEGKNLVPDVKKIVDTKGAAKVGGVMIDMFTASMISQIYDKVNDQNKKKMENSNIQTLVGLAQRMMQKNSVEKDGDNLGEGAFSVKLNKPYNRGDEKMYMDIIKKYGGKNLKYSPPKGRDLELDIFFDGGDVKKIKSNLPNKGKGSEWISEKVEYAEYKFKNKRDAQKALDYFKSQQLIKLDINDDGLNYGELAIDAGKKDMTKYHKEVLKKFKPIDSFGTTGNSPLKKVLDLKHKTKKENATAQQAAIAIAKKKKNESIMDSYRQMWESKNLEEKKEFKQKDIDIVAKLTDRNEHTLSLMHIAKAVGDRKAGNKLELISKLHMEYGSMTKDLMNMRNEIYDDLKKEMMKYSNGKDMYGAT